MLTQVKKNIYDKIIIGSKSLTDVYMWIYAAYAVHRNMRSHAVGAISMVHGVLHETALVQILNPKSSTGAELVGVSEYIP